MHISKFGLYWLLLLIGILWLGKKIWWILVILLIYLLLSAAGDKQQADEANPAVVQETSQPSAILQWFKDHTPKK